MNFHYVVQRFVRDVAKRLPLLYAFTNATHSQKCYAGISWRHEYGVAVPACSPRFNQIRYTESLR